MEFSLTSIINYMYTYQKDLANGVSSWECVLRRRRQCKSKVKLSATGEFLQIVNDHTHPPTPTQCEVTRVRAGIKRKAETTQDTTQQILAAGMHGISESAAVNLPSLNSMQRNMSPKTRQEPDSKPRQPRNHTSIAPGLPNYSNWRRIFNI